MPAVSVITPVHNRASTIRRAIESVKSQTYDNIEHIIVDDGSSDDTVEVVREHTTGSVRLIRFDEQQGANAARNAGIRASSSDIISFLDSDDEYLPQRIERTMDVLKMQPPHCVGVYHSYRVINNGKTKTNWRAVNDLVGLDEIRDENIIGGFSATLFRKELFKEVGYLDESMPSSQDYEFYLRALDGYKIRGIDEILVNYYQSSNSISSDIKNRERAHKRLSKKHGSKITNKRKSNQQYAIALLEAEQGNMDTARAKFRRAIKLNPWRGLYYYYYIASIMGKRGFEMSDRLKTILTEFLID